jgi:hypothetical protein
MYPVGNNNKNTPGQPQSSFVEDGITICRVSLSRREIIRMIGLQRRIFWTLNACLALHCQEIRPQRSPRAETTGIGAWMTAGRMGYIRDWCGTGNTVSVESAYSNN